MAEPTDGGDIGEMIVTAREARGMSLAELGELIGRAPEVIRAWEQGRGVPDERVISALAEALVLDARDLVGPDGPAPAPASPAGPVWLPIPPKSAGGGAPTVPAEGGAEERSRAGPERSTATAVAPESDALQVQGIRADPTPEPPAPPPAPAGGGFDPLAWAERVVTWVGNTWRRRRLLARAPTEVKSYVEDDRQTTTYRIRQVLTGVVLIVLILLLRWAWGQFAEAVSTLFDTIRSAV